MAKIFALLAGGKASRLGGVEKLNLDFQGKSLIDLILEKYEKTGLFDRFVVLSGTKNPANFKTEKTPEFISDIVEDGGPLIGLYSLILNVSPDDLIFLHGGDMPFTSPEIMLELYRLLEKGYDVAVPKIERGYEPLFAWYRASVKTAVENAVSQGKRRVVSFYPEVKVIELDMEKLTKLCNPETFFLNINSEEDYRKAAFLLESICEKKD